MVHVSIGRGVELLRRARADGDSVTGETCLHYLLYSEDDALPLGTHAKINPPLRRRDDVEDLWRYLIEGYLECVTSDHAPWPADLKARDDLFDAPSGAPGVEVLLPLFLDEARRRGLELHQAIGLLSEGPARCYGLYPRKGRLGIGSDADLIAYDPDAGAVVDVARHHSIAGWSPYHGRSYRGTVVTTIVGGCVAFDQGEIVAKPGSGRFVAPADSRDLCWRAHILTGRLTAVDRGAGRPV